MYARGRKREPLVRKVDSVFIVKVSEMFQLFKCTYYSLLALGNQSNFDIVFTFDGVFLFQGGSRRSGHVAFHQRARG